MRTERIGLAVVVTFGLSAFALAQDAKQPDAKETPAAKKATPPVAIVGADVYTVTKGVIRNGVIVIQDGKILKVQTHKRLDSTDYSYVLMSNMLPDVEPLNLRFEEACMRLVAQYFRAEGPAR